ncbi:hypothetical protein QYE76_015583 [Lolium multiflorum]|uniref:Uncharacterized protein n=1 Tax=Lolium multiflorum TaxID=4521 RepID=A0AAD8U2S4_LOLMU|nr:hypothetical protein QYE76_015583 [Lolium multiflorum]
MVYRLMERRGTNAMQSVHGNWYTVSACCTVVSPLLMKFMFIARKVLLCLHLGGGDSRHGRAGLGMVAPTMLLLPTMAEALSLMVTNTDEFMLYKGDNFMGNFIDVVDPLHILVLL